MTIEEAIKYTDKIRLTYASEEEAKANVDFILIARDALEKQIPRQLPRTKVKSLPLFKICPQLMQKRLSEKGMDLFMNVKSCDCGKPRFNSVCGWDDGGDLEEKPTYDFCPNCGAKMEEKNESI